VDDAYDPALTVIGEGPAVVLVPGMDGTGLLFYRQVPKLAQRYRVATYALRSTARTMSPLVDDLASIIERIAPDEQRAIVIGESFGGALALTLAAERPQRVAALVILNSFPYFAPLRAAAPPASGACGSARVAVGHDEDRAAADRVAAALGAHASD
jgi:pimeloyl-ACP methyl ester carboxylesterase